MDPKEAVRFIRTFGHVFDDEYQLISWDEVDIESGSDVTRYVGSRGAGEDWNRYWFFADLDRPTLAVIAIRPHGAFGAEDDDVVDIANVMLEDVTRYFRGDPSAGVTVMELGGPVMSYVGATVGAPGPYFDTTETRTRTLEVCEGTDGEAFRSTSWTYGCAHVCPDGYDGTCGRETARMRCYWQTTFSVDSDALQRLAGRSAAGFAAGNYNYRIESIGVNLVGAGLRSCEGIGGGFSNCYASGNLSFSLLHQGPFLVRNARGELYDAPLFPGRVAGRALAAERYLGNPLSSTDRGLIEPYVLREFRGRPLGGTMLLRIWDDNGLQFERLEDVQLLLNYRYWQHQR